MGRKHRKKKRVNKKRLSVLSDKPSTWVDLEKQLLYLKENRKKLIRDRELYYHKKQDQIDRIKYYEAISRQKLCGVDLYNGLTSLLSKTHRNQVPYPLSKDLYLYTWVDLYPDGTTKSVYSGEEKDPARSITEDRETLQKRFDEFSTYLKQVKNKDYDAFKELKAIEWKYKFNTEHIVPQSWFSAVEPMKGDLHHLFTCDPNCNITRSNYPYADFNFYTPESVHEPIRNRCGISFNEKFEPEHGKGKVARAMLYFLIRYPRAIKKTFRTEIDLPLLFRWHEEFPVTRYERHRNQTIYTIQGNRNPFIDFPNLSEKIDFPYYR